ncbi:hypothetical protein [Methylosinus sp. LW4]|uniref:hypothetical protein n=1 Tax=Methylosinus sp. LW4 TaxID=136993 RepID=UPI001FD9BF50|nr:hypothetical protein [Methylosinus sp. LW4]
MAFFREQSLEGVVLLTIEMRAIVRLLHPLELDREKIRETDIWRHEEAVTIAQYELRRLDVMGFQDHGRSTVSKHATHQREREKVIGVDEIDPLVADPFRQRGALAKLDEPRRLIAMDQRPPPVFEQGEARPAACRRAGKIALVDRQIGALGDVPRPSLSMRRVGRRRIHHGYGHDARSERAIRHGLAEDHSIGAARGPRRMNDSDRSPIESTAVARRTEAGSFYSPELRHAVQEAFLATAPSPS